jgi:hypothetical protein
VPVTAIVRLKHLIMFLQAKLQNSEETYDLNLLASVEAYRDKFGVDY